MIFEQLIKLLNNEISSDFFITQFDPILKKYSFLLNYEDAYNDLALSLLEFLNNIEINNIKNTSDGAIITYISKVMYSNYVHFSKLKNKYNSINIFISDESILTYVVTHKNDRRSIISIIRF